MIAILEKYEHNQDFHQIVDFVEAFHIRYALTFNPTIYVSHIRQFWSTARIKTTEEGTKILATVDGKLRTVSESSIRRNLKLNDEAIIRRTVPLFPSMLVTMGEGSGTPTEPHYTPTPKATPSPQHELSSSLLLPAITKPLPTVIPFDNPPLKQYTRRARIAQFSALPPVADEPASPIGDDSQGKACPTDSSLEADQDRANITKTSTLPSDSTPRVTSLAADEGNIQHQIQELKALCTSLQWQHIKMASKIEAQELEITNLKARVKLLEDSEGGGIAQSGNDAPIKGRSLDEGEEAAEKGSDDTIEMVTVLTSLDPVTVLSSRVAEVPLVVVLFPLLVTLLLEFPLAVARELEEEMARDAQRMNKQITRDAEIARIHAEEELQMMIDGLDRNNETVAKYLHEYYQFAT
nr:xylulose kinase-1 [Tanacetum cinerariifolium]